VLKRESLCIFSKSFMGKIADIGLIREKFGVDQNRHSPVQIRMPPPLKTKGLQIITVICKPFCIGPKSLTPAQCGFLAFRPMGEAQRLLLLSSRI
jgi:hypothetical protein